MKEIHRYLKNIYMLHYVLIDYQVNKNYLYVYL